MISCCSLSLCMEQLISVLIRIFDTRRRLQPAVKGVVVVVVVGGSEWGGVVEDEERQEGTAILSITPGAKEISMDAAAAAASSEEEECRHFHRQRALRCWRLSYKQQGALSGPARLPFPAELNIRRKECFTVNKMTFIF